MTAERSQVRDCLKPCPCYAAGKDKARFEGPPHAQDCGCQPCQVKRACLQKVMTLMARSSPEISICRRSGRWRTMASESATDNPLV